MSAKAKRKNGGSARSVTKVSSRNEKQVDLKAKDNPKLSKPAQPLTEAEKDQLKQSETTIGSGLGSFFDVGHALIKINTSRLYRDESDTFEDYCEQRWGIGRHYGYRLINAAECFALLKAGLPKGSRLPLNESQLRPLVKGLQSNKWVKAWKQVIADTSGKRLTSEAVEKVVNGLGGKSSHPKPKARNKTQTNVSKAIGSVVGRVDGALKKKNPSTSCLTKALRSIRRELKKLERMLGSLQSGK